MANSKRKCAFCKDRFPVETMIISGLSAYCCKEHQQAKAFKGKSDATKRALKRKPSQPTVSQEQQWLERITQYARHYGAFPQSEGRGAFDRHHVKGRTYKHNKVDIGRWYVIPVLKEFHDTLSTNKLNVTHFRKAYEEAFNSQLVQFLTMCEVIRIEDGYLPVPAEVMEAIEGLR